MFLLQLIPYHLSVMSQVRSLSYIKMTPVLQKTKSMKKDLMQLQA
ncbi:hypothetical protein ExPCM31_04858 [Escherichia coli]|nr:hypothetical protein ExPCM31_04858 [Escherichia coli]STK08043.1 Uncharacterised protein [Escherichia coli]